MRGRTERLDCPNRASAVSTLRLGAGTASASREGVGPANLLRRKVAKTMRLSQRATANRGGQDEEAPTRHQPGGVASSEKVSGVTQEAPRCCGEPLHWLIAESARGKEVARRVEVDSGIPFRIWRCAWCEHVTFEGWIPPTWITAIADACGEIRRELEADLARAYEPHIA